MIRDKNYNRESPYKIVKELVEKESRYKYYMWECKLCNKSFGPTQLANILQPRMGLCCKKSYEYELRSKKYTGMEGDLATPNKRLTRFVGESPGAFPKPQFLWECAHCQKQYGPSMLFAIQNYAESQCCQFGMYNQIGYGVITTARIKRQYSFAKRRGMECNLTAQYLDELWHKQKGKCAYTGLDFKSIDEASLDRIDSKRGYITDNVQWVIREVNTMKMDLSNERFLQLCSIISNRQKEKENDDSK